MALFQSSLHPLVEWFVVMVYVDFESSLLGESPLSREIPSPQEVFSLWPPQVGHDGATPESCWMLEELNIVAPTKGVMYNFVCKCWLARDKGDGLTSRILNILDAECVNIGIKVGTRLTLCL